MLLKISNLFIRYLATGCNLSLFNLVRHSYTIILIQSAILRRGAELFSAWPTSPKSNQILSKNFGEGSFSYTTSTGVRFFIFVSFRLTNSLSFLCLYLFLWINIVFFYFLLLYIFIVYFHENCLLGSTRSIISNESFVILNPMSLEYNRHKIYYSYNSVKPSLSDRETTQLLPLIRFSLLSSYFIYYWCFEKVLHVKWILYCNRITQSFSMITLCIYTYTKHTFITLSLSRSINQISLLNLSQFSEFIKGVSLRRKQNQE